MTNTNKNIKELSNIDIKEKILSMNREQLRSIRDASYFIGIGNIITLKEDLKQLEDLDEIISKSEFELLDNYMNKIINHLENSYKCNYKDESCTDIKELENIRQELQELSSIVLGYQIELEYVAEMVDEYGIKILAKNDYVGEEYSSHRVEELIDIIMDSLQNVKDDYNKYISIISEIISTLPMRLVKNNYISILKSSISRNLKLYTKPEIEFKIEDYKKKFDSSIRDGYGTKFDYYFREVQKLKNIDLSSKNLEDLDSIVYSMMDLTEKINELYSFIISLGLIMNNIIVVTLLNDIPISSEIEGIYNEWIQIIENNNEDRIERFNKKIENKIVKIEKFLFNNLDEFNQLNSEALLRDDFDDEELSEELLFTKKVLTIYNDISLVDYNKILAESEESVTDEYIEQVSDSLVQYINRSIIKMSNMERKIRMRKLLSLIELPFNNSEEFTNFIKYSLDNKLLSKEEINIKIDYILHYLEEVASLQ